MQYKISEFANLLGVTPDTLRHYEKSGIINPLKEDHSSYRYFNDLDCRNILRSRWFRSFDISMADTSHLITEGSFEEIRNTFADRSAALTVEISRLEGLLEKSKEIQKVCDNMETLLNMSTLEDFPGMYRICQTRNNSLIQDTSIKRTVKKWMALLPYTFFSFYIPDRARYKVEPDNLNYGLGISIKDAAYLDLDIPSHATLIPPSKCIKTYLMIKEGQFITKDILKKFEDFPLDKGLKSKSHITGKILFMESRDGATYNYYELCLPVTSA